MATDPRILGDLARTEMRGKDDTSLDVQRDLAIAPDGTQTDSDRSDDSGDPARDLAVPRSDLPRADR